MDDIGYEENVNYRDMYYDLLMCVENKYPGETRHMTAQRLIKEGQSMNYNEAKAVMEDKECGDI